MSSNCFCSAVAWRERRYPPCALDLNKGGSPKFEPTEFMLRSSRSRLYVLILLCIALLRLFIMGLLRLPPEEPGLLV